MYGSCHCRKSCSCCSKCSSSVVSAPCKAVHTQRRVSGQAVTSEGQWVGGYKGCGEAVERQRNDSGRPRRRRCKRRCKRYRLLRGRRVLVIQGAAAARRLALGRRLATGGPVLHLELRPRDRAASVEFEPGGSVRCHWKRLPHPVQKTVDCVSAMPLEGRHFAVGRCSDRCLTWISRSSLW